MRGKTLRDNALQRRYSQLRVNVRSTKEMKSNKEAAVEPSGSCIKVGLTIMSLSPGPKSPRPMEVKVIHRK